jgi:cell division septation protein DedD
MPSREPELYKDKIEVSLDGRQIFYLFFGGAVIVGMVFVLGVLVGRRVEARGHLDRADPQAASDPLAALDRLERNDKLGFRGALTGNEAPTEVEKAIGELEKKRGGGEAKPAAKQEAKAESVKPEVKAEVKPEVKVEAKTEPKAEAKPEADKRADKADRDDDKVEKKPRKHDDAARDHDGKKSSHGEPVTRPDGDGKAEAKAESKPDRADKPDGKATSDKVKFTLQLSSFQDRSEAEAYLGAIKSAGFSPYLTEAEVSGKGTFYRVRLGTYRSIDAANDAKAEYERSSKKTAQVMRL